MKGRTQIDTLYTYVPSSIVPSSPKVETTKYPSKDSWINKMWSIHTLEYDSVLLKSEILIQATTRMSLENMLSEISQAQKKCMIPLIGDSWSRQINRDRK